MKIFKKAIFSFLLLLVLIVSFGCSKSNVKNEMAQTESEKQEEIAPQGKYMIIKLKTNPSTGFDFVYSTTEDSIGDIDLEDTFDDNASTSNPKIVGASHIRSYVFSAQDCALGNVTLDFNYKRNWEGGENAYHVFYDVEIKKDGVIEYKGKRVKKEELEVDEEEFEDPTFTNEYTFYEEEVEEETEFTEEYEEEPEE